jgi:hypothetical protein
MESASLAASFAMKTGYHRDMHSRPASHEHASVRACKTGSSSTFAPSQRVVANLRIGKT